jgi:hypothetical protein
MTRKHFTAKETKEIGEKLGIDWSKYDVEQYRMGLDVELEHGRVDPHTNVTNDDPIMTGKIALAQLSTGIPVTNRRIPAYFMLTVSKALTPSRMSLQRSWAVMPLPQPA